MDKHALLTEELDIDQTKADAIIEALKEFAEDIGYSKDRIDSLECRSRDGFIPYSHNYGGIECVAFATPYSLLNGATGFPNADATIEKYRQMDIDNLAEDIGKPEKEWNEADWEKLNELQSNDDQASILYSLDIMHNGIERGIHTLNFRLCICVKDMPYHRKYDDLVEFDITFKTVDSLKKKLVSIAKRPEYKRLSSLLMDAY